MSDPTVYPLPLQDDLSGWKKVRIQVDVLPTGSKERIIKLKKDFEVTPMEGATDLYQVVDGSKQLINEGASVEFYVTVKSSAMPLENPHIQGVTFEVKVHLDLSAMAQMMGAMVANLMPGMGFLGEMVANSLPQEMEMLTGFIEVRAQQAVFEISLRKFRWDPIEKMKLTQYVAEKDIKALYKSGGELWIPVKVKTTQQSGDTVIRFEEGLSVCDVEGEVNWLGTSIAGEYRDGEDPKREFIVFIIPAAGLPSADLGGADVGNTMAGIT